MKHFNKKTWRILLIAFEVLVAIGILGVLFLDGRRLRRTNNVLKKAVTSYKAGKEEAAAQEIAESAAEEAETPERLTLSFRGDAFPIPGGDPTTTIASVIKWQLDLDGADIDVMDYSLDSASAVTQMYYAGVEKEFIDEIIEKNKNSDRVSPDDPNETTYGNIANLSLRREDQDTIPVLFIGNYGGWGNDPYELIEIQKKILETYNISGRYYLIGGNYWGNPDPLNVETVLQKYWGWHYIPIHGTLATADINTAGGHNSIARLLLDRLKRDYVYIPNPVY